MCGGKISSFFFFLFRFYVWLKRREKFGGGGKGFGGGGKGEGEQEQYVGRIVPNRNLGLHRIKPKCTENRKKNRKKKRKKKHHFRSKRDEIDVGWEITLSATKKCFGVAEFGLAQEASSYIHVVSVT